MMKIWTSQWKMILGFTLYPVFLSSLLLTFVYLKSTMMKCLLLENSVWYQSFLCVYIGPQHFSDTLNFSLFHNEIKVYFCKIIYWIWKSTALFLKEKKKYISRQKKQMYINSRILPKKKFWCQKIDFWHRWHLYLLISWIRFKMVICFLGWISQSINSFGTCLELGEQFELFFNCKKKVSNFPKAPFV